MSSWSFILDNLVYSFSSINTYKTCPYAYKLGYIDRKPQINNAFAQFGNAVHKVLEDYFLGKKDIWDLEKLYKEYYNQYVTIDYPPNRFVDLSHSYFDAGLKFFSEFEPPIDDFDVIHTETTILFDLTDDIKVTARPDLVLKDNTSGKIILFDYKTAKLKTSKRAKQQQIEEYLNQMYLYCYALKLAEKINIDEIRIWFIRDNEIICKEVTEEDIMASLEWFKNAVKSIRADEVWKPNNTEENRYFCENICGVRNSCQYWKKMIGLDIIENIEEM